MNTITLTLPQTLHEQARAMAERDQISFDQFVVRAVAEKLSGLKADDYLKARAQRGDRAKFERVLSQVPDLEPSPEDRFVE